MALVDNTILRRAASQAPKRPLLARATSLKLGVEFVGPRRFVDEVVRRNRPGIKCHRSVPSR